MSRGQIARWMLEEAQVDYKQVIVDYGPSMKSEDYLTINPMGKVPAIVHGGKIVTECAAICAYIADAFPSMGLAPSNAERPEYYRWLFFAAGPLESAVTNKSMGFETNEEQSRMAGFGTYDLTVETLSNWLSSNNYVCGDRFTAADVYVGSQIDWGLQFGTLPQTGAFKSYVERLRTRDAYKKAKNIDGALIAAAQES